MKQSQGTLSMGISLLAGAAGAVLATMMAISSLNAAPVRILVALLSCVVIWIAAGCVMVRGSFFRRKENLLLALLLLYLGLCLRVALLDQRVGGLYFVPEPMGCGNAGHDRSSGALHPHWRL